MPKIVDHPAYKQQLALKAAQVFLAQGYSQLGMRQLASELGVSKSKLYHYFPSKEALFSAATQAFIEQDIEQQAFASPLSPSQQLNTLVDVINSLLPRYAQELRLTLDYLDVIGEQNISSDSIMQLAQAKYRRLFAEIVGDDKAELAYSLALGILTNRLLSGDKHCTQADKSLLKSGLTL